MKKHVLLLLTGLILSASANAEVYNFRHAVPGITIPPPPDMTKDVACGYSHCYAVVNSEVWSIGSNTVGQLGTGNKTTQKEWVKTGLAGVSSVASGVYTGYAIKDGTVWSVGDNAYGQLGRAGDETTWQPTTLSGVSKVIAGQSHAYALKGSEVWAVGDNSTGQLGIGTKVRSVTWVKSGIDGISQIATGSNSGYAIKDSELYVVGYNEQGQLGLGNRTDQVSWVKTGITGVTGVAGGWYAGYIIKNGEVMSAGYGNNGALGNGKTTGSINTWFGTGFMAADSIHASPHTYSLYVRKGGDLYAVGTNGYGELGIGNSTNQSRFVKVPLSNVSAVIPARNVAFIVANGVILSAGINDNDLISRATADRRSLTFEEATYLPIKLKKD